MSQTTRFIYGTALAAICCSANPLVAQSTLTQSSVGGKPSFVAASLLTSVPLVSSDTEALPDAPEPASATVSGSLPYNSNTAAAAAKLTPSRYGMSLVSTTTRYGLGEVLHEDVSYHRCECSGILRRSSHALTQAFLAHMASGRAVPSLPALVAPFVGAEVGVAGQFPARYNASVALRESTDLYIGLPVQSLMDEFLRR